MTKRDLNFRAPPSMAIAADATTPNPEVFGVPVWSTTTNSTLTWDGTAWRAPSAGGGGIYYSDPALALVHAALLSF